jgi:hypothetical protein
MSSSATADACWTVVTKNDKKRIAKGRRTKKNNTPSPAIKQTTEDDTFTATDKERCTIAIQNCVEKLKQTDLHRNLVELLLLVSDNDDNDNTIKDIVCYGVGNFSGGVAANAPMWQLACIISLQTILSSSNVYYYDPCTTALELDILTTDLNMTVLTENERGLRITTTQTLFVMPHCPQLLYNNVLISNWTSLHNIWILGNSLHAYSGRQIGMPIHKGIEVLLPFIVEQELIISKQDLEDYHYLEAAFNDCHLVRIEIDADGAELPPLPVVLVDSDEPDNEVV